jgi:hypothetical protein
MSAISTIEKRLVRAKPASRKKIKWNWVASAGMFLLPAIINWIANEFLKRLPAYHGRLKKLKINPLAGTFVVEGLCLNRRAAFVEEPFVLVQRLEMKLHLTDLLLGKIVGSVNIVEPVVFVEAAPVAPGRETPTSLTQLLKKLQSLPPFVLKSIRIVEGQVFVRAPQSTSEDICLQDIHVDANGLTNSPSRSRSVVATVQGRARLMSSGQLRFSAELSQLFDSPVVHGALEVKNLDLTDFKKTISEKAGSNIQSGILHGVVSAVATTGRLKGSVQPVVEHLRLEDASSETLLGDLKARLVRVAVDLLKKRGTDRVGTRIDFDENLNDPSLSAVDVGVQIVKNALKKMVE